MPNQPAHRYSGRLGATARSPYVRGGGSAILGAGAWVKRTWARRADRRAARQRGQVLVMVAFGMVMLLGITGVGIDLGFGFAHRRQVANAAEAAAVAGAKALAHHVLYASMTDPAIGLDRSVIDLALGSPPASQAVDRYASTASIWQDIEAAAAATVPPFLDLGTAQNATPTWPPGAGNILHAWYLVPGANAPNGTEAVPIDGASSTAPPANAVGVRVEAQLRYGTFFSRVLGPCCDHVDTTASARAVLKPLTGNGPAEGGPYILCGGGASPSGAWVVATPGPSPLPAPTPPTPVITPILAPAATPAAVNMAVVGWTLGGYSPSLGQPEQGLGGADCGAGSRFNGLGDPQAACAPPGQLPCAAQGQLGSRAGRVPNALDGLNGCTSLTSGCVPLVAIAARPSGCSQATCAVSIVAYSCALITGLDVPVNNLTADTLVLLPACTVGGQAGPGTIAPNAPGAFTYKLVLDCDDPTSCGP